MTTSDILTLITDTASFIIFIGVIVGFVINFIYLNNLRKLLNYLRDKYPDKWKALGEPTVFTNNSPRNAIRVWRYIRKEEYKDIGDDELNKIGSKARKQLRLAIPYFVVLLLLFVIVIVSTYIASK